MYCWECKLVHPRGKCYGSSSELKTRTPIPASSHSSRIYPRKRNHDQEEIPALRVHWYIVTTAKTWKTQGSIDRRIDKEAVVRYTVEYFFIQVLLLYNVALHSTVQQSESAIHIYLPTPY